MIRLVCIFFLFAGCLRGAPRGADALLEAAIEQVGQTVRYDPAYSAIAYPMGDVPLDRGVCTDVVIRAFRRLGIDLQKEVHEDMRRAFADYPRIWRLRAPDPNIDHRRVPNLMRFFARRGKACPISREVSDYRAGDVVAWRLPDGRPHIGLVGKSEGDAGRPLVVHNIGAGTQVEDRLFDFEIIGHYRYF